MNNLYVSDEVFWTIVEKSDKTKKPFSLEYLANRIKDAEQTFRFSHGFTSSEWLQEQEYNKVIKFDSNIDMYHATVDAEYESSSDSNVSKYSTLKEKIDYLSDKIHKEYGLTINPIIEKVAVAVIEESKKTDKPFAWTYFKRRLNDVGAKGLEFQSTRDVNDSLGMLFLELERSNIIEYKHELRGFKAN